MSAIKVNNVQMYKNSYGKEVPVVEGKLILLSDKLPTNGKLEYDGIIINHRGYKPIIIHETEKIEAGNIAYHPSYNDGKFIVVTTETEADVLSDGGFKVLTLPEHFSPKHLQAIEDGKMKDGDNVLVECKFKYVEGEKFFIDNLDEVEIISQTEIENEHGTVFSISELSDTELRYAPKEYKVKFNPYITLFPKEETWSKIIEDACTRFNAPHDRVNLIEWLEKHYQVPKRK